VASSIGAGYFGGITKLAYRNIKTQEKKGKNGIDPLNHEGLIFFERDLYRAIGRQSLSKLSNKTTGGYQYE